MTRIAVIGAGPAGLFAALELAERGDDVVLYEASHQVGGMSASFEVAGQRVDYGSHRLHPATEPDLMARIRSLLGDDLQARTRNGRIRLEDRWVGFPLRPGPMVKELPLGFSARVGLDTATKPFRRGTPDSFATAIEQRLGPTVAERFYRPYAHKLYGEPAEMLTVELADKRVSATSPLQILAKALKTTTGDGRTFYYPRNGYGQISEAIADAAVAAGTDLRLSTPVTGIDAGDSRPDAVMVRAGASVEAFDLVASSMPIDLLTKALDPAPAPEVTDAVATLRTRAMVLVYLVLDRAQFTEFDAHYFPDAAIRTSRLSECKNYRDGDDPAASTVLCAEVPCWVGDELWSMADEELGELVADELVRSGLPTPSHIATETRRQARVYPTYERAHSDARSVVDGWRPDDPRILVFGRQGLSVPDNIHHVMAMGRDVAKVVVDGRIDHDAWDQALARFASNVVQD
ncbi:MAG: FAD-dependent oxidoreductase [Actinomycetota bacterium]